MPGITLLDQLNVPGASHAQIAERVINDPARVKTLIDGLGSAEARVKFGSAKVLRFVSERNPELLYPHFDFFVEMLGHKNKILQWEAVFVLSQLIRADARDKFEAVFDRYFAPISGPVMITAANVIAGGARIARARPGWADRIAREVLKVNPAHYQTDECRNIAIGHAIVCLGEIFDLIHDRQSVLRFIRRQRTNSRPAVRKKAEAFLKKHAATAK